MRNRSRSNRILALLVGLLAAMLLTGEGCAARTARMESEGRRSDMRNAAPPPTLDAGYRALERKEYQQAIDIADAFLKQSPTGAGSAEALYLKGRALEQKPAADPAESSATLQAARSAYIQALSRSPKQPLEWRIHAGLANVAYFQEDYPTALDQWTAAYVPDADAPSKAWMLYRIGRCQQRLARFEQADRTFVEVQRTYPNSEPATLAREDQGARAFYVQLATFRSPASAERATAALRAQGVKPIQLDDPAGRHIVRVGPLNTFAEAKAIRSRFAGPYPDAIIIP